MNWYPKHRRVVELEGGFEPRPIPPGFVPPPPSNVQRVLVEEPVDGWWRQAGAFGFRFSGLVPGEGEVIPITEQLHLPGPPAPWWVQFFRFDRNIVSGELTPNFELRARVTYGVGGIQNIFEVDLIQGIQFPVVCNAIKVDLVTYNPFPPAADGEPYNAGTVTVGAMFGKGSGGGALPPTWTTQQFSGIVDPGEDILAVPLPDFARSVGLRCTEPDVTAPALADISMRFRSSVGLMMQLNLATAYHELISEGGVPIPAGTNEIVLSGPFASSATAGYALQFFLAL